MKRIVIALGGNAILRAKEEGSFSNQYRNVEKTSKFLVDLVKEGYEIVIGHGNGPQVGNLVLQNEIAGGEVPAMPLHILTAETQGFIGYMLEETLTNQLLAENMEGEVATILTRVEVSKDDEAFKDPTKPIGRFYTFEEYEDLKDKKDWIIKKDANRGYRRVVYSPRPKKVLGVETIKKLLEAGRIVIASGGGGIPVVLENGSYKGVEAVIDKDFTSYKMAEGIGADVFMILTDVENVCINYARENEEKLTRVTVAQMEEYIEKGYFAKGSMLPKVEAAIEFARLGKEAYICSLEKAKEALEGNSGTRIVL